ncbi:M28 family peptidase [Pseudoclostridium thermosuccinogenes]|uniref:M28 family peptidase n=1 Tax=Clostridium thermosuccinogenes TaxID=84032 RepID=UPI002FDB23AE
MKLNQSKTIHKIIICLLAISITITACDTVSPSNQIEQTTDKQSLQQETQSHDDKASSSEISIIPSIEDMMETINTLCKSARPVGSSEEKNACDFLKETLSSYGYEVHVQTFPYETATLSAFNHDAFWDINGDRKDGDSQNLIAVKKADSDYEDSSIIIISAHYDSSENSPGANDNGSGVAVLLEIAKLIKNLPSNKEIRFILFGGEENALYGSRCYVKSLSENELKRIKANINLDTLAGKGPDDPRLLTIDGKINHATSIITGIDENKALEIGIAPLSDHFTFAQAGIASLTIGQIDTNFEIHTPEDNVDNIDKERLKIAADMVVRPLIKEICPDRYNEIIFK